MKRQRGASGIFVAVVLVLVAAGIIVALMFTGVSGKGDRGRQVAGSMTVVQTALRVFATGNGRLPCPANPNLTTGLESAGAAGACNFPAGTIPWATLGLRVDDAVDPWGEVLSYRVFAGSTGFTRTNGASMVNCTTDNTATGPLVGSNCDSAYNTPEASWLAGKGLKVNDFGAVVTDAAYVLISHGASGLGGYTSAGQQKTPLPASADELSNLSGVATTTYVAKAASAETVAADDPAHFDDIVAYAKIGDLVRAAGLGGRLWAGMPAGPGIGSTRLSAANIQAAMGSATPPVTGSLGVSSIDFGYATVTGGNSGGAANLTYNSNNGGGIGVTTGQLQSFNNEFLTIALDGPAGWFSFAAFNLNEAVVFGVTRIEQVKLTFSLAGTTVATKTVQACNFSPKLYSFSIDVATLFGTEFDTVEVRPVTATPLGNTSFYLSEFDTCASGSTSCPTGTGSADPTTICP